MNQAEMIPCDHVITQLWEYIDGELSEEQAAKVRAHLEICKRCFPQYNFQRAYKEFVRRSAQEPLPPGVRRRVFETILEEESGHPLPNGAPEGVMDRLKAKLSHLFGQEEE